MAQADGTVTIVLNGKDANFLSTVEKAAKSAKEKLGSVGDGAGDNISTNTKKNMNKAIEDVTSGKSKIDKALDKQTKLQLDTDPVKKSYKSVLKWYEEITGTKHAKIETEVKGNASKEIKEIFNDEKKVNQTGLKIKSEVTGNAQRDLKQTKKEAEELTSKKINLRANLSGDADKKAKETTNDMDRARKSTSRLKDIIEGTFISNAVMSGIYAMKNGLESLVKTGLAYNKEQDTMRTVWKSLTSEAPRDGQKLIDYINSISQHSIYAADTVNKMAQSFYHVHSSVSETERWTKAFVALGSTLHMSNDALAESGEQFAKIVAGGKASAEDMSTMINRFPMFGEALQKATGKSMKQLYAMSAAGKLSAKQFEQALDYLGKKYQGGTKEAMTSFLGMTMYLKSRWQVLTGDITKTAFNMNKSMLTDMRNLLSDNMMKKYAALASDAISVVTGAVVKVIKYLNQHKDTIIDLIGNLGQIAGIVGRTVWTTFGIIITNIGKAFGLIGSNANEAKDPLKALDDLTRTMANNKEAVKTVTQALLAVFAIKKAAAFTNSIKGIASTFGLLKGGAVAASAAEESAAKATETVTTKTGLLARIASRVFGSTGLLSGAALSVPGLLAVGAAIVAIGAAGYGLYRAKKYSDELGESVQKSQARFENYGVHISSSTAKAVGSINGQFQAIKGDMAEMDTATGRDAKKLSSDIATKYTNITRTLVGKIRTEASEAKTNLNSSLTGLGAVKSNLSYDSTQQDANKAVKKVQAANATIQKIVKNTGGDLSKMTAAQQEAYNKANDTLAYYTSGLARSEEDQESLMKEYASSNSKLSAGKYKELSRQADDYYASSLKKVRSFVASNKAEAKKLYDQGLINGAEYQARIARFTAQEESVVAKALLKRQATQNELNKHYQNTGTDDLYSGTSISSAYNGLMDKLYGKGYKSLLNGTYETRKEWIAETKKLNDKYLDAEKLMYTQDTKLGKNGQLEYKSLKGNYYLTQKQWLAETEDINAKTIKSDLKRNANSSATMRKYVKDQTAAYESAGHSRKVAVAQAKVDAAELIAQTNKTANATEKAAEKQSTAFAKGLSRKGSTAARAEIKKWGIDITNTTKKIDFGKYGQHTGADFWKEFKSGSKKGYEMARVYFQEQLDSSGKKLQRNGSKQVAMFKSGLNAGVISLKSLKSKFGSSIMNLFPSKGLTKLGKDDIKLLRQGLKSGTISDSMMKKKFGNEYNVLFKKDLSKLGKNDLATLRAGLKSGIINKSDLSKRFKKDLDSIYNKDLSKVGKKTLKSLAEGYKLGLPEAEKQMRALQKLVGNKTKIDVKGHGKTTMAGLNKMYKDGQITTSEYLNDLQKLLKNKTNISLKSNGSKTSHTYNTGFKDNFGAIFGNAHDLSSGVDKRMNPGQKGKPYSNGKTVSETFADGLAASAKYPLGNSAKIAQKTAGNFNSASTASGTLSKALGGSDKHTKISAPDLTYHFATGTLGRSIGRLTHSMVNDGPKVNGNNQEIILHQNGKAEPIQGQNVIRELVPGDEVLNAEQSQMMAPVLGLKHFANGSLVGNVTSWIKNAFKDVTDFLSHPIKNWKKLIDGTFDSSGFSGTQGSTIGGAAKTFEKNQTDWLKKLAIEGAGNPGGAGVTRWIPYIKRAAAAMHVSMPEDGIKKILNTINHESGGNPTVFQHGYVDVNTGVDPAQGLLQFIGQTFRYYAVKGHGNRANGYDQLLALFNDSNWYNDLMWNRGWAPSGHRRFATGGVVDRLTHALLGDDPTHPHETIVNEAQPTADGLLSQSISERAKQDPHGLYANLLKISQQTAFGQASMNRQVAETGSLNGSNDGSLKELTHVLKSAATQGNVYLGVQKVGNVIRKDTTSKTKNDAFWAGRTVTR